MRKGLRWPLLTLLCLLMTALAARADALAVGGTGSSETLLQRLFDDFRRQTPTATLKLVPALGSGGALKALAAGRIDLAVVGRALSPEEASTVGNSYPYRVRRLMQRYDYLPSRQ